VGGYENIGIREELSSPACELEREAANELQDILIDLSTRRTERGAPSCSRVRKMAMTILSEAAILKRYDTTISGSTIDEENKRERKRQKSRSKKSRGEEVNSFPEDELMQEFEEKTLKSMSPDAIRKMHEESAAAAVKNDYRERFTYTLPLQYVCRRPELRWEWRDKRQMIQRQVLIGGGTNSDLDNF